MKETTLRIRPPVILLECPLEEGYKTQQIGWGTKFSKRYKAFQIPFCPQTLVMVKRLFKNPVIVEGQHHIDSLKTRAQNIHDGRKSMSLKNYPSPERKFKLKPFAHQIDGLWYLKNFYGGALFADCGSGKSAMTLWDIESLYSEEKIKKSSVLIVGKLMTLFSGWASDTLKFTQLQGEVLWEPSKSEEKIEKTEIIKDHGPKPPGKGRTKRATEYYHHSGEIAILDSPRHFNPKRHVRKIREWKEVDGKKYSCERLISVKKTNVRSINIARAIGDRSSDIHIINHEGLIKFEKELIARKYDYIAIDESTAIKNPTSKIFKSLKKISYSAKYRRILSGTPSPQGPQDLWSQFYFLDNGLTLGPDYKEFLEQHFDMVRMGSLENGTYSGRKPCISPAGKRDTLGWIKAQLSNRVFRCKLRDCIDLPPLVSNIVDVYLDESQKKHYESMRESFCAEIDGKTVEVTVDLAKVMKLRQITGGFVLDSEGNVLKVSKTNPKLAALEECIAEIPADEKIVIFAVHRAEINMLLKKFGKKAVSIYGGISDVKKLNAQDRFINDPEIKYVICQPQSAAYGINGFTISRYLFFYSIDYRADTDYQAIKRIERAGQKRAMFVKYLIAKNTIDEVVYKIIKRKDKLQQQTINVKIFRQLSGIRQAV